ncbi:hypothetical protein [Streptomyces globosus]|uniref:hypothetical protein n=1 Tax=Streptomyces globosus TaxID=68209 RepID=UPI0031D0176A
MSDRTNTLAVSRTVPAAVRPDDACVLCGYWACRCNRPAFTGAVPPRPRPAARVYPADASADEMLRRVRAGR